jgi:hypothetical protein
VQPKAIAHPTDARLMHRAIVKLVDLAKRNAVPLRQSYARVASHPSFRSKVAPACAVICLPC